MAQEVSAFLWAEGGQKPTDPAQDATGFSVFEYGSSVKWLELANWTARGFLLSRAARAISIASSWS
jgi:hypothetical protein